MSTDPSGSNPHHMRPSAIRWLILLGLCALAFVSYLLRGNLSIAAPSMMAELHISEAQWGWVMGAFPLGYALFQIPGGVLGQRIGPRRILLLLAIGWSILIALTAAVPAAAPAIWVLGILIAIQFLVGAFHAPIFPVTALTIERWFPRGGWALPNGLTSSALTIGLALTASLLPWLVAQWGWRQAFLILAPSAVLVGVLWFRMARDEPAQHPRVNAAERALIGRQEAPPSADAVGWRRMLADRDVLLTTLSYASHNFVYYVVFSWGFYYLVNVRGFAEQDAGFLTSAQWLGAGIGAGVGGWLGDWACRRHGLRWGNRWPIMLGEIGSAVLLIGVAWMPQPLVAAVLLGLCFFFNQIAEGPYWGCVSAIGARDTGAASGVMNTGGNIMGFISAVLLSMLAQSLGWPMALTIGALFGMIAAVLMLAVRADRSSAEGSR